MSSTVSRYSGLTGPLAAVAFLGAFALSSAPPGTTAGGASVATFYRAHSGAQHLSDALWMVGLSLLVLFAGTLRTWVSTSGGAEGPATTGLVGAAIAAAGGTVYFGCDYVLASMPGTVAPAAAQALNLLALRLVLPLAAGIFVLGLAFGVALLRARTLPVWTGWAAVVLALTCLGGPFSLLLTGVWAATVGVLIVRRSPASDRAPVLDVRPAT